MPYFNPNNPQHRELADAYDQGNYDQLPQTQVLSHFQNFLQDTPPQEMKEVQQDYFNQMPQTQRMGLFSSLVDALGQRGVDPRQAGVSTVDPRQASPMDLGNLFSFAMNSGLLGNLMGGGNNNRQPQQQQSGGGGITDILGGLLGGNDQSQQPQQGYSRQPQQSQGGISDILGGLLGGGNDQPPEQSQSGYSRQPQASQGSGLEGILNNPLARAAISGLLAFGANQAMKGFAERNQSKQPRYDDANQNQMQKYPTGDGSGSALPGFEDEQQSPTNQGGGSALPGFENTQQKM